MSSGVIQYQGVSPLDGVVLFPCVLSMETGRRQKSVVAEHAWGQDHPIK